MSNAEVILILSTKLDRRLNFCRQTQSFIIRYHLSNLIDRRLMHRRHHWPRPARRPQQRRAKRICPHFSNFPCPTGKQWCPNPPKIGSSWRWSRLLLTILHASRRRSPSLLVQQPKNRQPMGNYSKVKSQPHLIIWNTVSGANRSN